jgi:CPA1 family monovalent cation:H+ antiporter
MDLFKLISLLIVLAALFSYLNYRLIWLPRMIGVMFLALVASLVLIGLGELGQSFRHAAATLVGSIDFNRLLLHGLLAFLLFAGSLQLDLHHMAGQWGAMTLLAVLGTLASTLIVGVLSWLMLGWLHWPIPLMDCLLFGAVISPTDPVAVLGIMKRVGASPRMETLISGESLFNDGVGVVLFIVLLELARGGQVISVGQVSYLLARQVVGGVALGVLTGWPIYRLLRRKDPYQPEVLMTLALAMGGYALGETLGVSAPITVVVAGLFVGRGRRAPASSPSKREHLDTFWELIDETLNAVLFLLMGLQVLVMPFNGRYFLAGLLMIPIVLLARGLSVGGIVAALRGVRSFERGTVVVLIWGGLRGGIAIALALSLPKSSPWHDLLLAITYCVAVFSILVQGLTVGRVIRAVGAGYQSAASPMDRVTVMNQ